MDVFSDFMNTIGSIAIDFNMGSWLLTLFAVWMGIGTAVFLKRNGIVLPLVKKTDIAKVGAVGDLVKMGTVGDFAMGFFISFGFSTAGIAPFFAWSLSTMLASAADWVRKKHEGRTSAIVILRVEVLELMELLQNDPKKFRVVIREKMGIDDEPDLPASEEDIPDPEQPELGSVVLCESEGESEPEDKVIPEPEPPSETPPPEE